MEKERKNPLLRLKDGLKEGETIPFEDIELEDILPALEEGIRLSDQELYEIKNDPKPPTFQNTIHRLYTGNRLMEFANTIISILNLVSSTNESIKLGQTIIGIYEDYSLKIWQDKELFKRVEELYNKKDSLGLVPEEMTLLIKTYDKFFRRGVHLPDKEREEFNKISIEMSGLSEKFDENLKLEVGEYFYNATRDELEGLNEDTLGGLRLNVIERLTKDFKNKHGIKKQEDWENIPKEEVGSFKEKVRVDNDELGYDIVLNARNLINNIFPYLKSRELRKKLWIDLNQECSSGNEYDNQEIIKEIVNIRMKIAKILGYNNYAEFALEERMAKDVPSVMDLLYGLKEKYYPLAKEDVSEISLFAKEMESDDFELMQWDSVFYSERLKERKYAFSQKEVSEYFLADRVIPKILDFVTDLYGITFKEEPHVQTWHPDVKVYSVWDKKGSLAHLGLIYMDIFSRKGEKRGGAWMYDFVVQEDNSEKYQRPHIQLCMNLQKSDSVKMKIDEVKTFLHELGHALHALFSNVKYYALAGTNVDRDFVELPSQIMENFFYEKWFIDKISSHYKTKEPLPDNLFQKILDAKRFNAGSSRIGQLTYGFLDMEWYTMTEEFTGNVLDIDASIFDSLKILPRTDIKSRISCRFSHIFTDDYSAGYYSYQWAEVLDAHAFEIMKSNGFSKEIRDSFRKNILERGGSEKPDVLYKRFAGEMPTIEPLLRRDGLI